jgi:hypothetical protein
VTGLEPHYVGKCEGDLIVRLAQIREPAPTQETHKRLNSLIREALAHGQAVEVLAWPVPAHELKAQRDALVWKLQPLWNSRQ